MAGFFLNKGGRAMRKKMLLLICILIMSLSATVYAQEDGNENQIEVTQESGDSKDVPFTNSEGETVYTLSAVTRNKEGAITMPKDRILILTSESVDLSDIEAVIDDSNVQAKKDLAVEVISASKNTAKICVNFSNRYVSTNLNWDGKILIKKGGSVIRKIALAYMTPYIRDEHDTGFQTLSAWSGTWGVLDGEQYRSSGKVDVYQENAQITFTYQSQGNQGVKAFHLDRSGNYTFSDGSYDIKAQNQSPRAYNTIKISLKPAYIRQLKEELINDLYQYSLDTKQCVFEDLMIEYEDGCIIGEVTDFVRLGHQATIKPLDKMTLKATVKSSSKIKLRWNKVDRVSGYAIYRYDSKMQKYDKIKTVSTQKTSYTDSKLKSGKKYRYKIVPYRSITYTQAGNLCKIVNGSASNIASSITKPGKPVIKAKKSGRRVKVKIKKVSRASGYKVYLRKGKKGHYKLVKTYKGNRARIYKSRKLKRKKTYYVKVRAYKTYQSKKYYGKFSKTKKIKIPKKKRHIKKK